LHILVKNDNIARYLKITTNYYVKKSMTIYWRKINKFKKDLGNN